MNQALQFLGLVTIFFFMYGFGKAAYSTWREFRRSYRCPHLDGSESIHMIFHLQVGPIAMQLCSACMQTHRDAMNRAPLDERDLSPKTPVPEIFRHAFKD